MLKVADLSKNYADITALQHINFHVSPGEVVGILGANGSGKTTLLKIISGIVAPTTGEITYTGTLSSLLEIGSGIHPDLTAKENYFMKGGLLGISKAVLHQRLPDLLDFTELSEWINKPVKHYSDGMYMRLAFGIALTLEADIYLFDEVLAVGDVRFQRKCFDIIQQLSAEGKIIIMVSHNVFELEKYCSRYIWLAQGRIKSMSESRDLLDEYIKNQLIDSDIASDILWKNNKLEIQNLTLTTSEGLNILTNTDEIVASLEVNVLQFIDQLNLTMHIQDHYGTPIFSISTATSDHWQEQVAPQQFKIRSTIDPDFLNPGFYTASIYIHIEKNVYQLRNLSSFSIAQSEKDEKSEYFSGRVRTKFQWRIS